MEKYTYKDVVTIKDVMTGEVDKDALIGKKGWVGDNIVDALGNANRNEGMCTLSGIDDIPHQTYPFIVNNTGFVYFVPAKNEDEEERS